MAESNDVSRSGNAPLKKKNAIREERKAEKKQRYATRKIEDRSDVQQNYSAPVRESSLKVARIYGRESTINRDENTKSTSRTVLGKTTKADFTADPENASDFRLTRLEKKSFLKKSVTEYNADGAIKTKKTRSKLRGTKFERYEKDANGKNILTHLKTSNYDERLSPPNADNKRILTQEFGLEKFRRFERDLSGKLTLTGRVDGSFSKFTDKSKDGKTSTTKIDHLDGLFKKSYQSTLNPDGSVADKFVTSRRIGLYRSSSQMTPAGDFSSKVRKLGKTGRLFEQNTQYDDNFKTVTFKALGGMLKFKKEIDLSSAEKVERQERNGVLQNSRQAWDNKSPPQPADVNTIVDRHKALQALQGGNGGLVVHELPPPGHSRPIRDGRAQALNELVSKDKAAPRSLASEIDEQISTWQGDVALAQSARSINGSGSRSQSTLANIIDRYNGTENKDGRTILSRSNSVVSGRESVDGHSTAFTTSNDFPDNASTRPSIALSESDHSRYSFNSMDYDDESRAVAPSDTSSRSNGISSTGKTDKRISAALSNDGQRNDDQSRSSRAQLDERNRARIYGR